MARRSIGMRWLCMLLVVVGCAAGNRPTVRSELSVEDAALWFMRAALAGDQATARTLTLQYSELALFSNRATDAAAWEASVQDVLDDLGRQSDDAIVDPVRARVIDRRTLDPARDRKVTREVEVAIVRYDVPTSDGGWRASPLAWLFVKTADGWKYSPKQ